MKIEGLEHALVSWGLAKDGALVIDIYGPLLFESSELAQSYAMRDEHPVRVYIIVEDD